jgi:hypothetical protein
VEKVGANQLTASLKAVPKKRLNIKLLSSRLSRLLKRFPSRLTSSLSRLKASIRLRRLMPISAILQSNSMKPLDFIRKPVRLNPIT